MYLHLGGGAVVPFGSVLGVFDLDKVSASYRTREFLEGAEDRGEIHTLGQRIPVSLVVTDRGSFLSPISSAALCKRLAENALE